MSDANPRNHPNICGISCTLSNGEILDSMYISLIELNIKRNPPN